MAVTHQRFFVGPLSLAWLLAGCFNDSSPSADGSGASSESGDMCRDGAVGCACFSNGTCDPGLVCNAGTCEPTEGESSGTTSGGATATGGSAGPTDTGSATADSDGMTSTTDGGTTGSDGTSSDSTTSGGTSTSTTGGGTSTSTTGGGTSTSTGTSTSSTSTTGGSTSTSTGTSTSSTSTTGGMQYDYYVDATKGSDDSPGTEAYPFKTISYALTVAMSGDQVKVAPGTYDGANGEAFPLIPAAGVTLIGDEANRGQGFVPTVVDGLGVVDASNDATFRIANVGVTLSGFSLKASTAVLDFEIYVNAAMDPAITNNTFLGSYGGIRLNGGNATIAYNHFATNSYGVYGTCGTGWILKNEFDLISLPLDILGGTCVIESNIIEGTGQVGIQVQGGSPLITGNTFTRTNGYLTYGAIHCYGNPKVRSNTFEMEAGPVVRIESSCSVDLGTMAEPGGNIMGAVSAVGVVHNSTAAIGARGNTWVQDPPKCGVDIVINGSGSVTFGNGMMDICP